MSNNMIVVVLIHFSIFCANMAILSKCEEKLGDMRECIILIFIIPVINILTLLFQIFIYYSVTSKCVFRYELDNSAYFCYRSKDDIGVLNNLGTGKIIMILNFNKLRAYLNSSIFEEYDFKKALIDVVKNADWDNEKPICTWDDDSKKFEVGVLNE